MGKTKNSLTTSSTQANNNDVEKLMHEDLSHPTEDVAGSWFSDDDSFNTRTSIAADDYANTGSSIAADDYAKTTNLFFGNYNVKPSSVTGNENLSTTGSITAVACKKSDQRHIGKRSETFKDGN